MRRSRIFTRQASLLTLASWLSAAACTCNRPSARPPDPDINRATGALSPDPLEPAAEQLRREAEAITRSAAGGPDSPPEATEPGPPPLPEPPAPPPAGAAPAALIPDRVQSVESPSVRRKLLAPKPTPAGEVPPPPKETRLELGFAGGPPREVARGLSPELLTPAPESSARGYTYGFLFLNEYLSDAVEEQLAGAGVELLGPHGDAHKVRVPVEPMRLQGVVALPFVEALTRAAPDQKLDPSVKDAAKRLASKLQALPLIVNVFDASALEEVRAWLSSNAKATVGRVDKSLLSIAAVVPLVALEKLTQLDGVLWVELSVSGKAQHAESMAVMGADYIRWSNGYQGFPGSTTTFGIMDSGFSLGRGQAPHHKDLEKGGCGRNFSGDKDGVWVDGTGHGTHVLATAIGTGTAPDERYRGVSPSVGTLPTAPVIAAKVWNSFGQSTLTGTKDAIEFLRHPTGCAGGTPLVASYSGGLAPSFLPGGPVGTDQVSRTIDQSVWEVRQTWVISAGNSGGDGPGSVTLPGVAKNALTVGNITDFGPNIGSVDESSGLGPTADGRMKPNLVAPGTSIMSAQGGTVSGYAPDSGSSMATPHVSGVAVSLLDHFAGYRGAPQLVRARLMATALMHEDPAAPTSGTATPRASRSSFGLGRVSPYVAHWDRHTAAGWSSLTVPLTISRNHWSYTEFDVPSNTKRLVVVLTWDEPPASSGANRAVMHDLDLWLDAAPFCKTSEEPNGQCGEFVSQSGTDNVEYRIIDNPAAGLYRLKAANLNAPRAGLPAAIAAVAVQGAIAPAMAFSATASTPVVEADDTVVVTTAVTSPSWVLSGVFLESLALPAGVTFVSVSTQREDNVTMSFETPKLSLGTIVEGDTRSALWRFRMETQGTKELSFRASSDNASSKEEVVTVTVPPTVRPASAL